MIKKVKKNCQKIIFKCVYFEVIGIIYIHNNKSSTVATALNQWMLCSTVLFLKPWLKMTKK